MRPAAGQRLARTEGVATSEGLVRHRSLLDHCYGRAADRAGGTRARFIAKYIGPAGAVNPGGPRTGMG